MLKSQICGASLAALCALTPVTGQSLSHALPEGTLMFMSFPDISTSVSEFQKMPLSRMWAEGEVQDFFADAMTMAEEYWDQGMAQAREAHEAGMLPVSPDDLAKLRIEGLSVAVTSMELMSTGGSDPLPKFGLVVHADFGDSAPIWKTVMGTAMGMLKMQAGDDMQMSESKVGDVTIQTMGPAGMDDFPMSGNMAWIGNGMVFGTLTSDVKSIIGNLQSGTKVLTASSAYQSVSSSLSPQGAEAEFYMRPGVALDFLINTLKMAQQEAPDFPQELSPEGIDRALTALGLRSLEGVGMTSNYVGDKCVTKTFAVVPEEKRRGFFAKANQLDTSFLKWVPKDAVSFSASSMNFSSIYDSLVDAMNAYNPDMAEMVLGQLGQMEEQLGMSLEKDLFGAFGDQFVTWSMPMAAFGTAPEMAVLVKVNNQERLLNTLQTISQMSEGTVELDKVERRGITVWQVRLDIDMGGAGMGFNPMDMFIPTFGFKNGYLVFGLSTGDVKRVFKRMDREDDPSGDIRSNGEFAPYFASVPKQGIDSLSFTDWKANFESMYQLGTSVLAFVPMDDSVPVDLSLLPDSSTLTQHLFGGISYSQTNENGYVSTSVSPFGPEMVIGLGALVVAGVGAYGYMSGEFR